MIAHALPSLVSARVGSDVILIGDSTLRPLIEAAPKSAGSNLPMFYIGRLSATLHDVRSAMRGADFDMAGRLDVELEGGLLTQGVNVSSNKIISSFITISSEDWSRTETNADRFVHLEQPPPKSFWESTLEPALVVLGAAVIVALFFLIRS